MYNGLNVVLQPSSLFCSLNILHYLHILSYMFRDLRFNVLLNQIYYLYCLSILVISLARHPHSVSSIRISPLRRTKSVIFKLYVFNNRPIHSKYVRITCRFQVVGKFIYISKKTFLCSKDVSICFTG